jgi:5-formyltetrahydrofolate cyclo-ligase
MDAAALQAWRTGMRAELIARRQAMAPQARAQASLAVSLHLLHLVPFEAGAVIGFCWPYRGEYDPRRLLRTLRGHGARNALPVVKGRAQPLHFRLWRPGVPMEKGALGIAAPTATSPEVAPDILLIPVVGFGRAGDRLGYGGGYFDRTLAASVPQPLAIGVGYELSHIESSYPQPHDIPMDAVVTEAGVRVRLGGQLVAMDAAKAKAELSELDISRRADARTTTTNIPTDLKFNLP